MEQMRGVRWASSILVGRRSEAWRLGLSGRVLRGGVAALRVDRSCSQHALLGPLCSRIANGKER